MPGSPLRVGQVIETSYIGSTILMLPSPALPTSASDCRRAAWPGAAKGALAGGLGGFLVSPFVLLAPAAIGGVRPPL